KKKKKLQCIAFYWRFSEVKKAELVKKIKELGGVFIDSQNFQNNATHLISEYLTCTEKFLNSCVKGLWVLSPKYIEDSYNLGSWQNEENYEHSIKDQNSLLVSASKRWRWKISFYKEQPFSGWKVSLMVESSKLSAYNRLLKYGGARILPMTLPLAAGQLYEITYVIMDPIYTDLVDQLLEYGILSLRDTFILDTILKDEELDPFDYQITNSPMKQNFNIEYEHFFSSLNKCSESKSSMQFLPSSSVPTFLTTDSVELQHKNSCVDQATNNYEPIMISDDEDDPNFKIKDKVNAIHIHEYNNIGSMQKKKQVSIKVVSRRDESILAIKPGIIHLEDVETGHNIKCTNLSDLSKATENLQCVVITNKANIFKDRILKEVEPQVQKKIANRKLSIENENKMKVENENHQEVYSTNVQCNSLKKNVYLYGLPDDSNLIVKSGTEIHDVINDKLLTPQVKSSTNDYQEYHTPLSNISDFDVLTITPKKEHKSSNASTAFLTLPPNIYLYGNSPLSQQKQLDKIKSEEINVKKLRKQRKRTFQKPLLSQSESVGDNCNKRHTSPKLLLQQNPLHHSKLDSKLLKKKLKFQVDVKKCKRRPNVSVVKKSASNAQATVSALDNDIAKLYANNSPTKGGKQLHDEMELTTSPSITKTTLCEKSFFSQISSSPFAISTPKKSQTSLKQFGFSSSFITGLQKPSLSTTVKKTLTSQVQTRRNLVKFLQLNEADKCNKDKKEEKSLKVKHYTGCLKQDTSHSPESKICVKNCDTSKSSLKSPLPLKTETSKSSYVILQERNWPLSYPLNVDLLSCSQATEMNKIFGQCMESDRELLISDFALSYSLPFLGHYPTPLLLRELLLLFLNEEVEVQRKAHQHMMSWLQLYPPVSPELTRVYSEAFNLTSDRYFLIDIFRNAVEKLDGAVGTLDGLERSTPVIWLFTYFVSMFEVNFDSCLKEGNQKSIQRSLIIKWLWGCPQAVFHNSSTNQLLNWLKNVISKPEPNLCLASAIFSLISLASEAIRLASVQWDISRSNFEEDSTHAIAYALATSLKSSFIVDNYELMASLLNCIHLNWLRTLVVSIILSSYNKHLLSDSSQLKSISLTSIVSQFFFLLPPLEDSYAAESSQHVFCNKPCKNENSKKHKLAHNLGKGRTSKINKKNCKGETALHISCKKNDFEKLKELLLTPGVNVNITDHYGWTPLHEACLHGSYECVKILLEYMPNIDSSQYLENYENSLKVDLNASSPDGITPLLDAVRNNHLDICQLLLKYGGKRLLNAKTIYGQTPLELAGSEEMKSVLRDVQLSDSLLELEKDVDNSQSYVDSKISHEDINVRATMFESDIAPLSSSYKLVVGSKYASVTQCSAFLTLLSILITSCLFSNIQQSNGKTENEKFVLKNLSFYVKLLKRHVKYICNPHDFQTLKFHLLIIKEICMNHEVTSI
ncbi:uncharacterized protein LOC131949099, partial [Physella acuta]|uniref:uncharacterized protein LOC131949099 n=1 Tax=Physella acuta TaxID=109671 RepID=UPI0027DADA9C